MASSLNGLGMIMIPGNRLCISAASEPVQKAKGGTHLVVDQREIDAPLGQMGMRFVGACGCQHAHALAGQDFLDHRGDQVLIVYDQGRSAGK